MEGTHHLFLSSCTSEIFYEALIFPKYFPLNEASLKSVALSREKVPGATLRRRNDTLGTELHTHPAYLCSNMHYFNPVAQNRPVPDGLGCGDTGRGEEERGYLVGAPFAGLNPVQESYRLPSTHM